MHYESHMISLKRETVTVALVLIIMTFLIPTTKTAFSNDYPPIPNSGVVIPKVTFPLHISWSRRAILDAQNQTVILRGIGRMGPEYNQEFSYRETSSNWYARDFKIAKNWGANFIRIPFNRDWYNSNATYRTNLKRMVNASMEENLMVLLDMHWMVNPSGSYAGQFPDGVWINDVTIDPNKMWAYDSYDIRGGPGKQNETALEWYARTTLPILKKVAQDFNGSYYDKVIGFEINEFWPDSNRTQNWFTIKRIVENMSDSIHALPGGGKYLIFWNPGFIGSYDFSQGQFKVGTSESQKIVYAPHFYINPNYVPWWSGYLGPNDGWNWTAYYKIGDSAAGREHMYTYLQYYENIFEGHKVPVVFDEIGVDSDCPQGLDDMLQWFEARGYGYNYWAWYGSNDPIAMHILWGDWLSLRPQGVRLVQHMLAGGRGQPVFAYSVGFNYAEKWIPSNMTYKLYIEQNLSSAELQIYAFQVDRYTKLRFSNGTVLDAINYWDNLTRLLTFSIKSSVGISLFNVNYSFNWNVYDSQGKNNITSVLTYKLFNGTQPLTYVRGQETLTNGMYSLKIFYYDVLIETVDLQTSLVGINPFGPTIYVNMVSHSSVSDGYIAFNATLSSIKIWSQTPTNLTFIAYGNLPASFAVKVPTNATSIHINGVPLAYGRDWLYDVSNSLITGKVTNFGTFEFSFQ